MLNKIYTLIVRKSFSQRQSNAPLTVCPAALMSAEAVFTPPSGLCNILRHVCDVIPLLLRLLARRAGGILPVVGVAAVVKRSSDGGTGRGEAEIQLLSPSWAGAPARRTDVVIGMMNGLAPTPMPHRPSRPPGEAAGDPRSNGNYLTIH